jgi:uncharacterized protein YjbJ (UPF0337 family)
MNRRRLREIPRNCGKSTVIKSSTRDEIEGSARTTAGIIKEETGKTLENPELQAEGNADQFVGSTQKTIGKIKKALGV